MSDIALSELPELEERLAWSAIVASEASELSRLSLRTHLRPAMPPPKTLDPAVEATISYTKKVNARAKRLGPVCTLGSRVSSAFVVEPPTASS